MDAAEIFQKESSTKPGVDLAAITDRMEIRKAVQSGDIQQAIERVNDLNPEVSGQGIQPQSLNNHGAKAAYCPRSAVMGCHHLYIGQCNSRNLFCTCRFWSSSISCHFTYSSSG